MAPTSRFPPILLVASLFACGVTQACASKDHHESHSTLAALEGDWILVGFAPGEALPAGAAAPTLVIEANGRISGMAGVNSYSGQLNMSEAQVGRFQTGPLAATLMAGAPEAMEIERQFLQAMGEADGFLALGSELSLTRAGSDVARFRRK